MKSASSLPSIFALPLITAFACAVPAGASPWPAWRGDAAGSGHTTATDLPLEWGKDRNVRWRVALPEAGNSTPIVHGDKIFVTQPVTAEKWRGLMCYDLRDGRLLWKNGLTYDQPERTHATNPYCSASAATDGTLVVAVYGSAGAAAYDFEGRELWRRDLGKIDHEWGSSSSPVLHGDLCYIYHGPGTGAALHALDKRTGKTVWKWDEPVWQPGERTDGFAGKSDGIIGAFSTPIVVKAGEREELVMSFPMEMKGFDLKTGEVLWTCSGLNPLVYSSPVVAGDIVIAMGGYNGNSIAVKAGGTGDVTTSHRLWHEVRHNGGIGTGVVVGDYYYYGGSVVSCMEIKTGKEIWKARLPEAGGSWGSYLLAGDRIYALSQKGSTAVFRANPEKLEVLAQSDLGEHTNSSPVPAGKAIIIRTHEALWCLGPKE
ncbi:MAG: PQQ-binding-like beta-propeller repeat protein [Verrucomicrobiales bacterium]|nr:PQQ-binding-like beta-propeller repeat protein [Verrucomicrobiales bacterium]